jgi:hypothetical protein
MNRIILALLCTLIALLGVPPSAVGAAAGLQKIFIPTPASNLPNIGQWVASDSQLVYVLSDPSMGPPNDPNRGYTFRNFHPQFFLATLGNKHGHFTSSKPRLLFTGAKGKTIGLGSILGGWLVYEEYDSSNPGGPWKIFARNVATGRQVLVDSRDSEGVPSLTPPPRSDGHTIIWQTWTRLQGNVTSVVRTYNLVTGQRRLLAAGGSPKTWAYAGVVISGQQAVIEKDSFAQQHAQILLVNLITGQIRPLTGAGAANSEPWISGETVVWKVGWRFSNGRGIMVSNLESGTQKLIAGFNTEAPEITAGRYLIFSGGSTTRVKLYDTQAGSLQVLAPQNDGYGVGNVVRAADHVVLYDQGKPCGNPNFICPGRLVVTHLP